MKKYNADKETGGNNWYYFLGAAEALVRWVHPTEGLIAQGKSIVPISVNVSRAHFTRENLAENECDLIQGYYFAKPMPAASFEEMLAP